MQEIKTFEDACAKLGIKSELPDFSMLPEKHQTAMTAHTQLEIIAEALNGGWVPDWTNEDERKYYPWFDLSSGFEVDVVCYICQSSLVSSRLCFKSRDIAKYAVSQFESLYRDYFLI